MTALTPAFKAIQERITKSLIPIIIETLDEYIFQKYFRNDFF